MVAILTVFDQYLSARGLRLDAVVIGGAALNLLGIVSRFTKDCDILFPEIPKEVADASRSFAAELRQSGEVLQDDWLNNGPASLASQLHPQWEQRLQTVFTGTAIHLRSLGRSDFLCAKLFALCDRGIDLGDCLALVPTPEEIGHVLPWLEVQDAHPGWPAHVRATLADIGRRLGHGV
ncbi:MAG TPA: DUF6036 family nucleotidyltransferase [Candidatus Saccharimonadales bacterium]|nr:DUF6036 family nucleotidyltransferase [Candidatus Saccharimonadales bacterium]